MPENKLLEVGDVFVLPFGAVVNVKIPAYFVYEHTFASDPTMTSLAVGRSKHFNPHAKLIRYCSDFIASINTMTGSKILNSELAEFIENKIELPKNQTFLITEETEFVVTRAEKMFEGRYGATWDIVAKSLTPDKKYCSKGTEIMFHQANIYNNTVSPIYYINPVRHMELTFV